MADPVGDRLPAIGGADSRSSARVRIDVQATTTLTHGVDLWGMAKQGFRCWDVSQGEMFPPTFQELVPAGHLVHFVSRLVAEDLAGCRPAGCG